MRGLMKTVGNSGNGWVQDVAALISVGAFIYVAATWVTIAEALVG